MPLQSKKLLQFIIPLSVICGAIGATISAGNSNQNYKKIIYYMMLAATLIFTFKHQIIRLVRHLPVKIKRGSVAYFVILAVSQILVTTYGGFFVAAMGIMLMAFLISDGIKNIHEANAIRNISIAAAGSISAIIYAYVGNVSWLYMFRWNIWRIFFC